MRLTRTQNDDREPIGIVIADGGNGDKAPQLSAFVWGPVPDDLDDDMLLDSEDRLALASR